MGAYFCIIICFLPEICNKIMHLYDRNQYEEQSARKLEWILRNIDVKRKIRNKGLKKQ